MKKILLTIILLTNFIVNAQTYPVIEEFNPGTTWLFTNGAGIQNYGGAQNYATTNIGTTPYPNSSTVTITSPVYNFSNCSSNLTVSFPLSGRIENGFDFLRFQYWNGVSWVTQQSFTGTQNTTYSYSFPTWITQFRFVLITDNTVNTYFSGGTTKVYYYDIANFTINCSSLLPIELISFEGFEVNCNNFLRWITTSEVNFNKFELERSVDGVNFINISTIKSNETHNYSFIDNYFNSDLTYYRLKQIDNNSTFKYSNIIDIYSNCSDKRKIKNIYNLLGQIVDENYSGLIIIEYSNGNIIKKFNQ